MKHQLGVVVIGRNEGKNLGPCFESLRVTGAPIVYVDSGSSDGSPELAEGHCSKVVRLDPTRPFSAARARNEGFEALLALHPEIELVQFIDGDCTLLPGWFERAREAFAQRPELAIAIGHLVERHADRSVYNRLCALEWKSPAGDITNSGALGGIMMVRASVFTELGGFNAQVIAGEDSEFGVRVGLSHRVVSKLGVEMATHDANITSFRQWWWRSVRAGHAIGQRADLNGSSTAQDCQHERRSTLAWGIAMPVLGLGLSVASPPLVAVPLVAYGYLFSRVYAHRKGTGDDPSDARLYAAYTVLAKFANGLGLLKYYWNKRAGLFQIIEYK